MPRYGFACQDCKKRFRIFLTYTQYDQGEAQCPYCQGKNLAQLMNRVRFSRSADSLADDFSAMDGMEGLDGLEEDPKALGKMMRQMSREAGEDLGPEFDEVVSRLEKGQSPEEIEEAMPDLGAGLDDGPGSMMGGGDIEDF